MSKYPLKLRIWKADYTQPDPTGKLTDYVVKARYDSDEGFIILDPHNGNERADVYENRADSDEDSFYWVDKIILGADPRK